jgi:hypothetical protein
VSTLSNNNITPTLGPKSLNENSGAATDNVAQVSFQAFLVENQNLGIVILDAPVPTGVESRGSYQGEY